MEDNLHRTKLIDKLIDIANKHEIKYSVPVGGAEFADFIFNVEEDMMLGVQLAPVGSAKPLLTFPDEQELNFEDLDELLNEIA